MPRRWLRASRYSAMDSHVNWTPFSIALRGMVSEELSHFVDRIISGAALIREVGEEYLND